MLVKSLNIQKLIIEVDALIVANFFTAANTKVDFSHPYSAIIIDCRYLLQHFEEALINYVQCEGNHCADLLAKEGINSPSNFTVHPSPSSYILYQLLADSWGVVYPRHYILP